MKSFVTIAIMFNLAALAELPPSLDDVLFSMTGGTNYVAWIATEGEIAFRKPFSLFGSARFRSFHPTNDAPSLHYSITMEKRFYGVASPSNIIESLKQAEGVLQKQFEQRFSRREDSSSYQSKCIDIDGLGWDASFCVEPVSDRNAMPRRDGLFRARIFSISVNAGKVRRWLSWRLLLRSQMYARPLERVFVSLI